MTEDGLPASPCPFCGANLDDFMKVRGEPKPSPNDLTLCAYCAHLCVFDENMLLRKPTTLEALGARDIPELQRAQAHLKRLLAERQRSAGI